MPAFSNAYTELNLPACRARNCGLEVFVDIDRNMIIWQHGKGEGEAVLEVPCDGPPFTTEMLGEWIARVHTYEILAPIATIVNIGDLPVDIDVIHMDLR